MRSEELARFRPGATELLHELAVACEPDQAVAVLGVAFRSRPMPVGDQDVAVGSRCTRAWLNEGVGAGTRYAGLAQRQQKFAVGIELEDLIALDARDARCVAEGAAIDSPEVAISVAAEAVRKRERHIEVGHNLSGGIDVHNGWIGPMLEPHTSLLVRH